MINRIFIAMVVCIALIVAGAEGNKDTQGAAGHPQVNLLLLLIMCLEGIVGIALLVVSYG